MASIDSRSLWGKNETGSTNVDVDPSKSGKTKRSIRASRASKKSQRSEAESRLTDDEVKYLVVNDICREIVKTALDQIYENYLEKQTVYFVSHCCRLAWKALVEWNFQQKDRGGYREPDAESEDVETVTSPKDSWAGHSVPIDREDKRRSRFADMELQTEEATPVASLLSYPMSRRETPCKSRLSLTPRLSKPHAPSSAKSKLEKIINKTKRSDDIQPVRLEVKDRAVRDEGKKETYELPAPAPLQTKHFPSSRVEVQYAIMPGNKPKGTSLANKNELKTKTIVLKKPEENGKCKIKPTSTPKK